MRLATVLAAGGERAPAERAAVVVGAQVHLFDAGTSVLDLVRRGLPAALAAGAEVARRPGRPLAGVRLLAPLRPTSVRDFVTFEEHVEGVRRSVEDATGVPEAWYDAPTFYFTNPHTVLGPSDPVAFPARSTARDLELEVGVVVGRDGTSLDVEQARDHVFGYTVLADWSARDLQSREMQVGLGPAKGKDFATSIGPWLVTADELEEHRDADGFLDLGCTASVNGEVVGRDRLSHMAWTFEALVAHASRDSRVVAGDLLGSGTVGGGCLAELWGRRGRRDPAPLGDGDLVTLAVEGIGVLETRVGSAPPSPAVPAARRRARVGS